MAIAAMVVGILSLVTFWLCGLGALLGLVAVVLGAVALSEGEQDPGTHRAAVRPSPASSPVRSRS